jgi:hypothetical protein
MSGRAAKFRVIERGEIRLRRRRINSMRLKDFSTSKSASKDAVKLDCGEGELIQ